MTTSSTGYIADPLFSLIDFHFYPEDLYGEPRNGPKYPRDIKSALSTTIAFTIGSSSPKPIRIQNLFVRVLEVEPLEQSTFPISEGGGNGVTPVLGWVELEPKVGRYRVMTEARKNVGVGREPADFYLRIFCQTGSRFKISIEIEWMDLGQQERTNKYSFKREDIVELPRMFQWQKLASKAQNLRMLFSPMDVYFLKIRFFRLRAKNLTILCPTSENFNLAEFQDLMESAGGKKILQNNITFVTQSQLNGLTNMVGTHDEPSEIIGPTRQFIIVDNKKLILHNNDEYHLAEVVSDQARVDRVIEVFDELVWRFRN